MTSSSIPTVAVPPSVVILGSDALLTALPATPTQLANACYAAGYEGVFPASWGDELVAAGCLKNLETRIGPAILCTCPLVTEQLRGVAPLQRFQLHLVSPPVAAARYLRALCDDAPLRITYVGDCPGADDPAIDERASPADFLRRLAERGLAPSSQRPDLGANVPRDRRRFYSLPGGAPTPEWLSADWPKRTLVDLDAGEALADLAHHALERESTLIDFAPQLGCACSGGVGGIAPSAARKAVAALEPPRARQEVLDPDLRIVVEAPQPLRPGREEVSWDDFLAALPRALVAEGPSAASGAPTETVELPSRQRPRESQAVPRSTPTPAPRVTRRRVGAPETGEPGAREAERAPAHTATRTTMSTAMTVTPKSSPTVRTTQPIPRRTAVVEGTSGPRYVVPVARRALTTGDRWLLIAFVLGGSVLSSALTSYLVMRGVVERVAGAAATVATASGPPSAPPAPPAPAAPPTAGGDRDSLAAGGRADSLAAVPTPPPLGDQRTLAASAAAAAAAEAARATPRKSAAGAPPRGTALRRAASPTPRPAPVRTTPPPVTQAAAAAAPTTTPSDSASPPPVVIPVAPSATGAAVAGGPARADSGSAAPAPAATAPAITTAPAPTAAPQAAPQTDISAELRAIREELAARKHRIDSLTSSLDSMKDTPPPR